MESLVLKQKKIPRSCNRHDDCDKAAEEYTKQTGKPYTPANFHCYDDECPDCFGN